MLTCDYVNKFNREIFVIKVVFRLYKSLTISLKKHYNRLSILFFKAKLLQFLGSLSCALRIQVSIPVSLAQSVEILHIIC